MSIEKALADNTAAIIALTAAMSAGGKPAAAASSAPKAATVAAGPTKEQVNAMLEKVKTDKGTDAAKTIVKGAGFAKMAEITADKYADVFAACEKALAATDDL